MHRNIRFIGGGVVVTIKMNDGKVYTEPDKIKIERNEGTEMLFRILEEYEKKEETV